MSNTYTNKGLSFNITIDEPNNETIAALSEYNEMKSNPTKYKRYSTFQDAFKEEILNT